MKDIPTDITAATQHFNITPHSIKYACCPECFALYPPGHVQHSFLSDTSRDQQIGPPYIRALPYMDADLDLTSRKPGDLTYPEVCTFRETPEGRSCGARLLRLARPSSDPAMSTVSARPRLIRTYSHQSLTSWIGRMMCRPDFERMINQSLVRTRSTSEAQESVVDILQSEEVIGFMDAEGDPFLRRHESEARLLFSLFIDWFNPRGNGRAGASVSAGVIFMACLNLPPNVRYRPENMYIAGVIPGPQEPKLTNVNHFLRPLIDDLEEAWRRGIFLRLRMISYDGSAVCELGDS